ncbi:MAG: hypothetical protein KIT62_05190 [Cyclobacteriaceae bacterium]|nr:hypothetical protein [Cyclobacteriaceae bacterium]
MKILFVNNFNFPDYQNDMIYHGLIDLNYEVYETAYPYYMLSSYPNPLSLYGKGFSIFAKLNHTPKLESSEIIIEKIKLKFYDLVIYGSVHRDITYLNIVKQFYSKDRIYFIDGEDRTIYKKDLLNIGVYYKRECVDNKSKPIHFAIPEAQLLKNTVDKNKMFATVIPGNISTYIFNDESSYYNDYASSFYGITCKKAGWDCMRHYEILANKCIPYFIKLEKCPRLTMKDFPKEIVLETNEYAKKNKIHPNYEIINNSLFDYTKNNLTTKALINKIIN